MAKVMLLDGNSLAYRAFFALPADMATAGGQVTNAVYGFTAMLQFLLNEHRPELLACAFDRPEPTFRHEMLAGSGHDYKAGRAETPDILRQQMGLIRQVVQVLDVPSIEIVGFEADDVIATLATQAAARGDDVIIVTGDRDSYQLVQDPYVRVLYNKRGVSDYALYDEAGIVEKTGVHPTKYAEYAALRGDPSDNLPGVPGVGEKTAAKLINDFGNIDNIYANLGGLTAKLKANLAEHEAQVRRNAAATPLIRDVPNVTVELMGVPAPDVTAARELFRALEFRAMSDRVIKAFALSFGESEGVETSEAPPDVTHFAVQVTRVHNATALASALGAHRGWGVMARWSGQEGRSELTEVAFGMADGSAVVAPGAAVVDGGANALLCGERGAFHGHRAKEFLRGVLAARKDSATAAPDFLEIGDGLGIDTALAGYLLDPAEKVYALDELSVKYAAIDLRGPGAPPDGQLDLSGASTEPDEELARRAVAVALLEKPLSAALEARGLLSLYDDIERPLVAVLARMEVVGVRVDTLYLKELSQSLAIQASDLEREVQAIAGHPFVLGSVPQLRTVLFDELGLKTDKKTKTGYSTDAQALEKLRDEHPIVAPLLRWREVEKLRTTYGESLAAEVASDGRIHASFNQTVARTGRLSSDQPNLHNIPIRSEEGRQFRRAFIPAEGCELLVADYNQIELRVIAHLSGDPGLVEAFRSGTDIHTATASRVFGVDPASVDIAMRSKAKMVSYGLAYGMESYGLAQRLNIPTKEAKGILEAYFVAFPKVKGYMDDAVADARNKGYTETLFGRRRQIPELQSPNYSTRAMGERQAMNAGIQGLAADIFKVALVALDRRLAERSMRSRLILQVHDEVVLEVPPQERELAREITVEALMSAAALDVPLMVNVSWGTTWAETKG